MASTAQHALRRYRSHRRRRVAPPPLATTFYCNQFTNRQSRVHHARCSICQRTDLIAMKALAESGFIDMCGTDRQGAYVFAIYAYRLPAQALLGGDTAAITNYIIDTMQSYVTNDYSIVYFHQGMRENSKPPASFLWNAHKELDRSFKKNLKQLYVVHPTWWIRTVWYLFRSFVSVKFKNKIVYTANLAELRQALGANQLKVPQEIVV